MIMLLSHPPSNQNSRNAARALAATSLLLASAVLLPKAWVLLLGQQQAPFKRSWCRVLKDISYLWGRREQPNDLRRRFVVMAKSESIRALTPLHLNSFII